MPTIEFWRVGFTENGGEHVEYTDECRDMLTRLAEALAMDAPMSVLRPLLAHTDTCQLCGREARAIQNFARMGDHIQTRKSVADLYVYHHRSRGSDPLCRSRLTHPR